MGFAGDLHDPDTGLVRFGYRDYDPDTGRFTALDPLGYAAGDSDLYGYCLDDPVNLVDSSGLQAGALAGDVTIGWFEGFPGHVCVDPGDTGICYGKYPADSERFVDKMNYGWQNLDATIKKETKAPTDTFTIKTTPEQDKQIMSYVEQQQKNTAPYSLGSTGEDTDCRGFVKGALDAGGIETDFQWKTSPKTYYEETKKKYGN